MLTSRERLILEFETLHPKAGGTKDEHIRRTFGFSAVRYYQLLHGLAARQDAEAEYPLLVHRLRRMAVSRADKRAEAS